MGNALPLRRRRHARHLGIGGTGGSGGGGTQSPTNGTEIVARSTWAGLSALTTGGSTATKPEPFDTGSSAATEELATTAYQAAFEGAISITINEPPHANAVQQWEYWVETFDFDTGTSLGMARRTFTGTYEGAVAAKNAEDPYGGSGPDPLGDIPQWNWRVAGIHNVPDPDGVSGGGTIEGYVYTQKTWDATNPQTVQTKEQIAAMTADAPLSWLDDVTSPPSNPLSDEQWLARPSASPQASGGWKHDTGHYIPEGGAAEVRLRRTDTSEEAMQQPITRTFLRVRQVGNDITDVATVTLSIAAGEKVSHTGTGPGAANGSVVLLGRPDANNKADAVTDKLVGMSIDIDSDNNNGFDQPDGSVIEQAMKGIQGNDQKPGKVILTTDGDIDHDGVPDYADGYDLDDNLERDDNCPGLKFVPIVFHLPVIDWDRAKIKFQYSSSDPTHVRATLSNAFSIPAEGKLRLWKKDGNVFRSGKSLQSGGDFAASDTEYSMGQIGLNRGSSDVTLYVETVHESSETADLEVKMQFDPTGTMGFDSVSDSIRITATRVELVGRGFGEVEFSVVDRLNTSAISLSSDDRENCPPLTANSYITNRVNVYDPRQSGINQCKLNGQSMELNYMGGFYQTEEFITAAAGEEMDISNPPSKRVDIGSEPVRFEYNPFWPFSSTPKPIAPPKSYADVARLIKETTEDMKSQNWTGTGFGSFGTEVHNRVGAQLQGKSGWLVNVTVDAATNQIRAIGNNLPPGQVLGTTQIDLLSVQKSYLPKVGDTLDQSKVINLFDIKTSIDGRIGADQLNRLKNVIGGRDIIIAKSEWRWTAAKGWLKNKLFGSGFKILGLIAAASTAYAWVNYADYEDELDQVRSAMLIARQETDENQKKLYAIAASDKMRVYLGHFVGSSTTLDLIHMGRVYQIISDDSFSQDEN